MYSQEEANIASIDETMQMMAATAPIFTASRELNFDDLFNEPDV